MNKRKIFFVFALLFFSYTRAQDIDYAKAAISKLCSPAFHGRGYVGRGDKKAAQFIVSELRKNKLKTFGNEYLQPLSFPVNTFPSKVEINYGNQKLQGGRDFLVDASSPSYRNNIKLLYIDSLFFVEHKGLNEQLKKLTNKQFLPVLNLTSEQSVKIITVNQKLLTLLNQKGIPVLLIVDKLTYGASTKVTAAPIIYILKGILRNDISIISINIKNKYYSNYQSNNVAAYIEGQTDSLIVFTAHYDHLGRMGKDVYFPGAHDNASGVALLLNLAQYFSFSENKPRHSIAFLFFTGEEAGLIGSLYFANNPLFDLSRIRFLFNLDLMGSGEDGIQVVNATVFDKDFEILTTINDNKKYLKTIKPRGAAANSDHYPFYEKGVPCFFAYTLGAYKEYHNTEDKAENVPLNTYNEIFKLIIDFVSLR